MLDHYMDYEDESIGRVREMEQFGVLALGFSIYNSKKYSSMRGSVPV